MHSDLFTRAMLSVIAASLVFISVIQFLSFRHQGDDHDVTITGVSTRIRGELPVTVENSIKVREIEEAITVSSIEDPITVSEIQDDVPIATPLRVTVER